MPFSSNLTSRLSTALSSVAQELLSAISHLSVPVLVTGDLAVDPHKSESYVFNKGSPAAISITAPTASTDDGVRITLISDSAQAHVLTTAGLLDTGSANVNVATFFAAKGASMSLLAYNGRWKVISQIGITFT